MIKTFTLATLLALTIGAAAPAGDPLIARAAVVNSNLHAFTATMNAHVVLTSFPYISADVVANVYHKDPDLNKVQITSGLPFIASAFSTLFPHLEPPAMWDRLYTVTRESDYGVVTFKLVPKVHGNIDHIDATIDGATALVTEMQWTYANGGTAHVVNTYSKIGDDFVVTAQNGTVDEPTYKGTIDAKLDGYKLNPPIDDSVFTQ